MPLRSLTVPAPAARRGALSGALRPNSSSPRGAHGTRLDPLVSPPFDLRELRAFVAVAQEGQLTRAAAKLGLAQPAMSHCLSNLEHRAGIGLLERHARGVSLTPAGEAFLGKARAVLAASQEAVSCVEPWARGESRLSFGFTASTQELTRPLRRQFAQRHPGVELETYCLSARERLAKLRAGSIDVEVLYPPPGDSDFVTRTLLVSPRYVVLCERHRLASRQQLLLADIADETVPDRHPHVWEERCADAWLLGCRGYEPPVTSEMPVGFDELWTLVYSGRAIAVLPGFMLSDAVGHGVRAIPLLDVPALEVVLARRSNERRRIVQGLLDLCAELAADDPEGAERVVAA
jgi:DNA-binding transcriptional LysR family regulator